MPTRGRSVEAKRASGSDAPARTLEELAASGSDAPARGAAGGSDAPARGTLPVSRLHTPTPERTTHYFSKCIICSRSWGVTITKMVVALFVQGPWYL